MSTTRIQFQSAGAVSRKVHERREQEALRIKAGWQCPECFGANITRRDSRFHEEKETYRENEIAADRDSPFMEFWKLLNDLMRSQGQPELLYGEARGWWAQYQGGF